MKLAIRSIKNSKAFGLKPNKSPDQSTTYRPISLLSPLAKLMEKLLLGKLTKHLQLSEHQHGFRRMHSTTTALHAIHDHIQRGLNKKRVLSPTLFNLYMSRLPRFRLKASNL